MDVCNSQSTDNLEGAVDCENGRRWEVGISGLLCPQDLQSTTGFSDTCYHEVLVVIKMPPSFQLESRFRESRFPAQQLPAQNDVILS